MALLRLESKVVASFALPINAVGVGGTASFAFAAVAIGEVVLISVWRTIVLAPGKAVATSMDLAGTAVLVSA